jgi:hypothetical protein
MKTIASPVDAPKARQPRANAQPLVDRSERWRRYRYTLERGGTFAEEEYRWWVQVQYVIRLGLGLDQQYM